MHTTLEQIDRVITFSFKPDDTKAFANINKLKEYSRETGVTFSFLVLKAIDNYLKDSNGSTK